MPAGSTSATLSLYVVPFLLLLKGYWVQPGIWICGFIFEVSNSIQLPCLENKTVVTGVSKDLEWTELASGSDSAAR